MSVWGYTHECVCVCVCVGCVCVWVSGCLVRYASESEPVGIRKVDLGHKYLISVCCPWKSSIYSWPNGKMHLRDPPSVIDKKKLQLREATGGTLTWCGWRRKEAMSVGGEKIKCSSAADEKSSLGSYRWIAFRNPLIVCLVWKELWYDIKKKLSQTVKYLILCVWYCLTVKQNKYQPENAGLDTGATQYFVNIF